MIRAGDTGQHRHAIAVAVRAPDTEYETAKIPELDVEPGGEVHLVVGVHNLSAISDTLHLAVEGVPDGWAHVEPHSLRLGSGHRREADVSVRIPHTPGANATSWEIRVVVHSGVHGRRVASAAAIVHITPHAVLAVELEPPDLRTRRRARGELRVVNSGNAAADVELVARDGDGRLGFRVTPPRLRVEAGGEASAGVEVSAPRRRWLGRPALSALMVEADASASGATALGTFQQLPLLPRWVLIVPLLVAAAAAWVASRPTQVAVPRVTGLSVPEAREKLLDAGLKVQQAAMPAEDPRHPEAGVVDQEPDAGEELPAGGDVTISYEQAGGPATVSPRVDASSVAPPQGDSEPLAFARANRIFVRFPGEDELSIAGEVGEVSSDPAWDPATGEVAYVRRRSPGAEAGIVAVDPRAPGGERRLTASGRSYTNPAFSAGGRLLALVADDGSGYGGQLCVAAPPASLPHCREDADWRYARPAFAGDDTLYVLRRRDTTTRDGGWDELVRVRARDLAVEREPVVHGDLRSVAVARDGRIAVLARPASDGDYHVEILSPEGKRLAVQGFPDHSCDVAWSGEDLVLSRKSCEPGHPAGDIVRLDPATLDGAAIKLADGEDPAAAG